MSSSQSVAVFGPSTMTGSPQWMPSLLSTRAMLFFGRQENHMRYVSPSRSTEMSKHVPRSPPRTGLLRYFRQPAAASSRPSAVVPPALPRRRLRPGALTAGSFAVRRPSRPAAATSSPSASTRSPVPRRYRRPVLVVEDRQLPAVIGDAVQAEVSPRTPSGTSGLTSTTRSARGRRPDQARDDQVAEPRVVVVPPAILVRAGPAVMQDGPRAIQRPESGSRFSSIQGTTVPSGRLRCCARA